MRFAYSSVKTLKRKNRSKSVEKDSNLRQREYVDNTFFPADSEDPIAIDQDPSKLYVIKRNGETVPYDIQKIVVAISKAYLAVEGGTAAESSRVHELADKLAAEITDSFFQHHLSRPIHIEYIQDKVELCLMRSGEHQVARRYVLYREERAKERQEKGQGFAQRQSADGRG